LSIPELGMIEKWQWWRRSLWLIQEELDGIL